MINLREAIYYAVREDFNALIALDRGDTEPFIDQKNDALIREAIRMFDCGEINLDNFLTLELDAVAHAAHRRGIPPPKTPCEQKEGTSYA